MKCFLWITFTRTVNNLWICIGNIHDTIPWIPVKRFVGFLDFWLAYSRKTLPKNWRFFPTKKNKEIPTYSFYSFSLSFSFFFVTSFELFWLFWFVIFFLESKLKYILEYQFVTGTYFFKFWYHHGIFKESNSKTHRRGSGIFLLTETVKHIIMAYPLGCVCFKTSVNVLKNLDHDDAYFTKFCTRNVEE